MQIFVIHDVNLRRAVRQTRTYILLAMIVVGCGIAIGTGNVAHAAPVDAEVRVKGPTTIDLVPQKGYTVTVEITNRSGSRWLSEGQERVALNTIARVGQTSALFHPFWTAPYRPSKLPPQGIAPGETVSLRFAIRAPTKTGIVNETFALVSARNGTISGSTFSLTVFSLPENHARLLGGRVYGVSGNAGSFASAWIPIANVGTRSWDHTVHVEEDTSSPNRGLFTTPEWSGTNATTLSATLGTFGITALTVPIKLPPTPGEYVGTFHLARGAVPIPGSEMTFHVTSLAAAPLSLETTTGEPMMRIGLFRSSNPVTLFSHTSAHLDDNQGARITDVSAGQEVTASYDAVAKLYRITVSEMQFTSQMPPRLEPNSSSLITISSYQNRPAWNTTLNDNVFRGVMELRATGSGNEVWIINELPAEQYLRGLAETSDSEPQEYLRALITAARSYALYHHSTQTKHGSEGFDVNASSDQVYRGYGFETRSPHVTSAVIASAGEVLTHPWAQDPSKNPNGIIAAAYSSGTDGRTRNWCDVWTCAHPSSDFPWARSVPDPGGIIPNALTLSGNHMVGLSATGARASAEAGNSALKILTYYYSGVSLKRIY